MIIYYKVLFLPNPRYLGDFNQLDNFINFVLDIITLNVNNYGYL